MADWTRALPGPRSPRVKDGEGVPLFIIMRRLLVEWRNDPQKLAVAAVAYNLMGFWSGAIVWDVASAGEPRADGTWIKSITDDEAIGLLERAFFRKNRLNLRHRAEGFLWALEELGPDAAEMAMHRRREDACVIECRELSLKERVAALDRRPICEPVEQVDA